MGLTGLPPPPPERPRSSGCWGCLIPLFLSSLGLGSLFLAVVLAFGQSDETKNAVWGGVSVVEGTVLICILGIGVLCFGAAIYAFVELGRKR